MRIRILSAEVMSDCPSRRWRLEFNHELSALAGRSLIAQVTTVASHDGARYVKAEATAGSALLECLEQLMGRRDSRPGIAEVYLRGSRGGHDANFQMLRGGIFHGAETILRQV